MLLKWQSCRLLHKRASNSTESRPICPSLFTTFSRGRGGDFAAAARTGAEQQDGSDTGPLQPLRHQKPLAVLRVHHLGVLSFDGDGPAPSPAVKLVAGRVSCEELLADGVCCARARLLDSSLW